MPIYMDRHDVSEMVTAEIVAQLHQEDLKIQDEFDCKGLTYWFDDKRKMAFCLVEAPSQQHIINMHNHAHGEVPHQIIEVDVNVVETFLGRIDDPENSHESDLNIINDPAFRALMVIDFHNFTIEEKQFNGQSGRSACMKLIRNTLKQYSTSVAKQDEHSFLLSFRTVSESVQCALAIHTEFAEWKKTVKCREGSINIGLCAGVPVTGNKSFFEEAIITAERMSFISGSKIMITDEMKKLCRNENLSGFIYDDLIESLSPSYEKFFNKLMNFIEEVWRNPDLHLDDFGRHLGFSKSQLYRKINTLTGMSPNNFIKEYRLNKALGLINEQAGNISEIAFDSGFSSPSYFTKCFHAKFGMSPSEYQNRI